MAVRVADRKKQAQPIPQGPEGWEGSPVEPGTQEMPISSAPPMEQIYSPFAPLQQVANPGGAIPNSFFFTPEIAAKYANMPSPSTGRISLPAGGGRPQAGGSGGLFSNLGDLESEDIWRSAVASGVLNNTDVIRNMVRGNTGVGTGLAQLGGAIGDSAALGYLDRETGQPISTYAPLLNSLVSAIAPNSAASAVTGWIANPVSSAVNAFTGAAGSTAASAGAGAGSAAGTAAAGEAAGAAATSGGAGAAGSGILSGFAQVAPIAAIGFAAAELGNYHIEHSDRRMAEWSQGTGIVPMDIKPAGGGRANIISGLEEVYQMPNGKIVARQDAEWLYRLSQETGKGNEEADTKYNQALADLQSDDWHSQHLNEKTRNRIQELGGRY
jgi:hypothetical protein